MPVTDGNTRSRFDAVLAPRAAPLMPQLHLLPLLLTLTHCSN
jgi:hypothetical protein